MRKLINTLLLCFFVIATACAASEEIPQNPLEPLLRRWICLSMSIPEPAFADHMKAVNNPTSYFIVHYTREQRPIDTEKEMTWSELDKTYISVLRPKDISFREIVLSGKTLKTRFVDTNALVKDDWEFIETTGAYAAGVYWPRLFKVYTKTAILSFTLTDDNRAWIMSKSDRN